jgi:hypothetical protein
MHKIGKVFVDGLQANSIPNILKFQRNSLFNRPLLFNIYENLLKDSIDILKIAILYAAEPILLT